MTQITDVVMTINTMPTFNSLDKSCEIMDLSSFKATCHSKVDISVPLKCF